MGAVKEFIQRNKPVFTIGLITFVVFILIIAINTTRKPQNPNLIRLEEGDTRISENGTDNVTNEIDTTNAITEGSSPEEIATSFDEKVKPLEIGYYEKWGFVPKINSAFVGQLVRWKNETEKDIYFTQKRELYPELENLEPITIKPGETYEFRLTQEGLWTYEENETKNFGSIDTKPAPTL